MSYNRFVNSYDNSHICSENKQQVFINAPFGQKKIIVLFTLSACRVKGPYV